MLDMVAATAFTPSIPWRDTDIVMSSMSTDATPVVPFDAARIPGEIWYLILSLLSTSTPTSLHSLRLTSRHFVGLTSPFLFRTFRWASPVSSVGQGAGASDMLARAQRPGLWSMTRAAYVGQTKNQKWNEATAPLPRYMLEFLPLLRNVRTLAMRRVAMEMGLLEVLVGLKELRELELNTCSFPLLEADVQPLKGRFKLSSLTINEPRGAYWEHWSACMLLFARCTLRTLRLLGDEYNFASFLVLAHPTLCSLSLQALDIRLIDSDLSLIASFLASQPSLRSLKLRVDSYWQPGSSCLPLPPTALPHLEELYCPCDASLWRALVTGRPIRTFGRYDPVISESAANAMVCTALHAIRLASPRRLRLDLPWIEKVDDVFCDMVLPLLPLHLVSLTMRVIEELSGDIVESRLRNALDYLPNLQFLCLKFFRVNPNNAKVIQSTHRVQAEILLHWGSVCPDLRSVVLGETEWVWVGVGEWLAYDRESEEWDTPRAGVRYLYADKCEKAKRHAISVDRMSFWARDS